MIKHALLLASLLVWPPGRQPTAPDAWGFFAHRRINRLAVLTLPPDMMVFYKKNIDWIADRAVYPDMRRYATRNEAPRHFIDLDIHGQYPFETLPRDFIDALLQNTDLFAVTAARDTLQVVQKGQTPPVGYRQWFANNILPAFYLENNQIPIDSAPRLRELLGWTDTQPWRSLLFKEHLSEHGIVPWHLQRMQQRLTRAFRQRDPGSILRLSAEFGHYIADACVPLHTCSNYNGQKTGQDGIHGFWESRIPELFADEQYDYFVGKPDYIPDTRTFFWDIALESHLLVDSVLSIEMKLRQSYPSDRQMCPELRGRTLFTLPCAEFAAAYQTAMNGMVERRMRRAIRATASAWMTAWIDAGQPSLKDFGAQIPSTADQEETEALRKAAEAGRMIGREEGH
jgi:hypothetical protein